MLSLYLKRKISCLIINLQGKYLAVDREEIFSCQNIMNFNLFCPIGTCKILKKVIRQFKLLWPNSFGKGTFH